MEQSIKIKIADKEFELKVTSTEHEEIIRKAAADINSKVGLWLEKYPKKNLSDILSLVALKICISNIQLQRMVQSAKTETESLAAEIEGYLENIEKNSR